MLVGIHGSGLNNAILLPEGSVLVQLLPYKLNYKGAFQQVQVLACLLIWVQVRRKGQKEEHKVTKRTKKERRG